MRNSALLDRCWSVLPTFGLGLLGMVACTRQVESRGAGHASAAPGLPGEPGNQPNEATPSTPTTPGTTPTPPLPGVFSPAPGKLRRLTAHQYQNSLLDSLGDKLQLPTDLEPDLALSSFASVGASQLSISSEATEQFERIALQASQSVLTDPAWRSAHVACSPAGIQDPTCNQTFIRSIGERVWRRPLTDLEATRWSTIASSAAVAAGDFWVGLSWGLAGLLQSPNFLYRVELGWPDPQDPSVFRLDNYELASRLSYLLWNTTPDAALLGAAKAQMLTSPTGLRAETERLLAGPRARSGLGEFWFERLRLGTLPASPHPTTTFPAFTATLPQSMQLETSAFIDHLVFDGDSDIRALFDSPTTLINDELATL